MLKGLALKAFRLLFLFLNYFFVNRNIKQSMALISNDTFARKILKLLESAMIIR